jgi:mannose-6-phosphate isomerase-like protein (cupin superfamily)
VVTGTATCTIEGETVVVRAGGSVDVGVQHAHRIANLHDEALVIIEVQRGPYLGEDDIVRLQDDYGRNEAGAR